MKQRFFLPLLTFPQVCTEAFLSRAVSFARRHRAILHAVVFDAARPFERALRGAGDSIAADDAVCRQQVEMMIRAAEIQASLNDVELVTDWVGVDENHSRRIVVDRARDHDLILLESSRYNSTLYAVSEALVFRSGAPCLVLPPGPFSGRFNHIVIAWDDSASANKAVREAEPFLRQAARVTVLVISGERRMPENSALRLVEMLRSTVPTVEAVVLPGPDSGEGIQLGALKLGGSLLVMGGFGHSRLRELLFGGTTADVIRNTLMPAMIVH